MMIDQLAESPKPTQEKLARSCDDGVAAAKNALATQSRPIFLADEFSSNELQNANAIGWNSVYATQENLSRLPKKSSE
jgi:hypothetical protein